jgi:hypothetical protein
MWVIATALYVGAALGGGTIFGLLRPLQGRYWGRYLTAALVIFFVYAGGAIVLGPTLTGERREPGTVSGVLVVAGLVAIVFAPLYVRIAERHWRPPAI